MLASYFYNIYIIMFSCHVQWKQWFETKNDFTLFYLTDDKLKNIIVFNIILHILCYRNAQRGDVFASHRLYYYLTLPKIIAELIENVIWNGYYTCRMMVPIWRLFLYVCS